ncbi:photoreceptor cilium actin regulator [Brachyhypopomus gauderio]|uniref:photoreceptor cilium actin regulator n=1 Tax=Brachyhypopomus gauderio TaxID=698409 RepID=UPI0040430071
MGCSPSRRNNFSGSQGPLWKGRTLPPDAKEIPAYVQSNRAPGDPGRGEIDKTACETTTGEKELNICASTDSVFSGKKISGDEPTAATISPEKCVLADSSVSLLPQTKEKHREKREETKNESKGSKRSKKGSKNPKQSKKKHEKKSALGEKVDFPEPLVNAHQAAYGYLNPSIAKYEMILGLLDHAAQTQLSLQPMVSFMALCYEEINRGLQELVDEGEKLLKENGEHLAWPSNMKNLSSSRRPTSTEPPPDLLQQLLQYTVQRMRVVGHSVGGVGDAALEEAVDYFSSICEVLEEKLKAKRAADARLMQFLTRIEAASVQRPGPEDSALFSEDSGIGAESESLAGFDRQHRRRGSCESTASRHTILHSPRSWTLSSRGSPRQQFTENMSNGATLCTLNSTCITAGKEPQETEPLTGNDTEEELREENKTRCVEEHSKGKNRMRSSSSVLEHQPRRMPAKRIENPQNVEMTLKMKDAISGRIQFVPSQHSGMMAKAAGPKVSDPQWTDEGDRTSKRPQTATPQCPKKKIIVTKQCRSRSAESLRSKAEDSTLLELERTQKELSQRLERMKKGNMKKNSHKQTQGQARPAGSFIEPTQLRHVNNRLPSSNGKTGIAKMVTGKQDVGKEMVEEKKRKNKSVMGQLKSTPTPSPPTSPQHSFGLVQCGNSVKKLIDTFSQGMEETNERAKELGPLKGVRKCGIPIIPGLGRALTVKCNEHDNSDNQGESRSSERNEDLDLDNLPPPALEVLMDTSFENAEAIKTCKSVTQRGRSTFPKRTTMSQRLCASIQPVTVLPSKANMRKSSLSMSPVRRAPQDHSGLVKNSDFGPKSKAELEDEEAACLYKQARKVIHLQHSSESFTLQNAAENATVRALNQSNVEEKQSGGSTPETVPSTPIARGKLPSMPVSRTRVLPSTPVLHRTLPSPPVLKKHPVPPSFSSPPTFRKLPTPPGQRTLPATPAVPQVLDPGSVSGAIYPFKGPSPPASPKVQKKDLPPRGLSNARSVFCPASSSLFEAQPFPVPKPPQAWTNPGSSILPRPWGERGRSPLSVRAPQSFIRRSQSDRRPSATTRAPVMSIGQTCGSEPAISIQG